MRAELLALLLVSCAPKQRIEAPLRVEVPPSDLEGVWEGEARLAAGGTCVSPVATTGFRFRIVHEPARGARWRLIDESEVPLSSQLAWMGASSWEYWSETAYEPGQMRFSGRSGGGEGDVVATGRIDVFLRPPDRLDGTLSLAFVRKEFGGGGRVACSVLFRISGARSK